MTSFSAYASRFLSQSSHLAPSSVAPSSADEPNPLFYSTASGFELGSGAQESEASSELGRQDSSGSGMGATSAGPGGEVREIDDEQDPHLWGSDAASTIPADSATGSQVATRTHDGGEDEGEEEDAEGRGISVMMNPTKTKGSKGKTLKAADDPFVDEEDLDAQIAALDTPSSFHHDTGKHASIDPYDLRGDEAEERDSLLFDADADGKDGGGQGLRAVDGRHPRQALPGSQRWQGGALSKMFGGAGPAPGSGGYRGKGWLAHQSVLPSSSLTQANLSPHTSTQPSRRVPADIYRYDPGGSARSFESNSSPREPYHDEAGEGDEEDDLVPPDFLSSPPKGRGMRGGHYAANQAQASVHLPRPSSPPSYLRHPLLGPSRPGGGRSPRRDPNDPFASATEEDDVTTLFVYPAPPAREGWGPWASRVGMGKYEDAPWLAAWLGSLIATAIVGGIAVWGVEPSKSKPPGSPDAKLPSPYSTLTRSIPLLCLLSAASFYLVAAFAFVFPRFASLSSSPLARAVCKAALLGVPSVLVISSFWAFAGSFFYEEEQWRNSWWTTTGLRLFSLVPVVVAVVFAKMVWARRARVERTMRVVEVATGILVGHPALLGLSVLCIIAFASVSIPFLTIFIRLFLIGHFSKTTERGGWSWHIEARAGWLAFATFCVWLWTWAVVRGVMRVTVAGVVSQYYFHRDGPDAPSPDQVVRAAFARATGPSLGSSCQAGLILSLTQTASLAASQARRISRSSRLPDLLSPISHLSAFFAFVHGAMDSFSRYALIYVGITGDPFWQSARKVVTFTNTRGIKGLVEGMLVNLLLRVASVSLALLAGIGGFLYAAHSLSDPVDAPLLALLCAVVPFWILRFCGDLLANAVDTLYICFAIDRATEQDHFPKAKEAFMTGEEQLPV